MVIIKKIIGFVLILFGFFTSYIVIKYGIDNGIFKLIYSIDEYIRKIKYAILLALSISPILIGYELMKEGKKG